MLQTAPPPLTLTTADGGGPSGDPATLGAARDVPSMLSDRERLLYLWLAEHHATGAGALVDLGAFLGGSTACLAEGQRRGGRDAPVHGFDRFTCTPQTLAPYTGVPCPPGAPVPTRDMAEANLAPWAETVTLHASDLSAARWNGGPIEVLAVDAAKSARLADRIGAVFFPHLIPGRSLVIQQDFGHWKTPWLAAQMARMADAFAPVHYCAPDTMVFRCIAPVTEEVLAHGRLQGLSDDALTAALAALDAPVAADRIRALAEAIRANPACRRAKDMITRPAT